jgi:hypothetical protein
MELETLADRRDRGLSLMLMPSKLTNVMVHEPARPRSQLTWPLFEQPWAF